ncbi:cell division protein FtsL [Achromobacter sp. F4_2707]|uniref:cell division protein FtsL n=1 Tax=Achromobacter sp. F4_2707 TaxID=3114286 RepID=UPI0039C5DC52
MGRLCIVLAVILMVSAISLVTARHQSRQLFVAVEQLEDRSRELDIEWRRLQLERAELARNARIDHIARSDLGMVTATPDRSIYLDHPVTQQGGRP